MIKRFSQKGEKLVLLKTLADMCDITYLLLDHPQYFHNTGFVTLYGEKFRKSIEFWTEVFWMLNVILDFFITANLIKRI